jgi:hypothetical protein
VDDRTPAILEIPEIKGGYYTAQILDEWGEVIAHINERTFPSKPYGKFALVKLDFRGTVPIDARIELHSTKPKCLAAWRLRTIRRAPSVSAAVQGHSAEHAADRAAACHPDVR